MAADIRELLKFYAEAGVDEAIEESPVDRFAEFAAQRAAGGRTAAPAVEARPAAKPAVTQPQESAPSYAPPGPSGMEDRGPPRSAPLTASVPDSGQILLARELAARATTLDELHQAMARVRRLQPQIHGEIAGVFRRQSRTAR